MKALIGGVCSFLLLLAVAAIYVFGVWVPELRASAQQNMMHASTCAVDFQKLTMDFSGSGAIQLKYAQGDARLDAVRDIQSALLSSTNTNHPTPLPGLNSDWNMKFTDDNNREIERLRDEIKGGRR